MAIEITMPQLSDTMHEGRILLWRKKEGDKVERGDALAEVATDKADLEIESFNVGTLLKILAPAGTLVKVGTVIAYLGDANEVVASETAESKPSSPEPEQVEPKPAEVKPVEAVKADEGVSFKQEKDLRVKISPLAKNIAEKYGIDYQKVQGSGDGGRIVRQDIERLLGRELNEGEIEAVVSGQMTKPLPGEVKEVASSAQIPMAVGSSGSASMLSGVQGEVVSQQLSRMRETIAARMTESTSTTPHFYVTARIDVAAVSKARESLLSIPIYEGLTVNHFVIKAAALALRKVPRINAAYRNGQLIQPEGVNIGIVTALADGLLIPVLKNADTVPLSELVTEARALIQRARVGKPKPDDLVGGTFTISNIGKSAVEHFTAIINPGQGAILAVSSIQDEPVVSNGTIVCGKVMRVTLSSDHRIIDGVAAGQFITEFKRLLEDPVILLAS